MTLQSELTENMCQGETSGRFALTIVLREFNEDGAKYYVAECLEIPGCVSQGDTEEEARQNIEEALELCLSVMLEDCMKQAMAHRQMPDLTGIKSQRTMNVGMPQLQYA